MWNYLHVLQRELSTAYRNIDIYDPRLLAKQFACIITLAPHGVLGVDTAIIPILQIRKQPKEIPQELIATAQQRADLEQLCLLL